MIRVLSTFVFAICCQSTVLAGTISGDTTLCTTFQMNDGYAGWQFNGMLQRQLVPAEGGHSNSVRITDRLGPVSAGIAPPVFHGDWSLWNEQGFVQFDIKIEPSNPADTLLSGYPVLLLSGPGGSAQINAWPSDLLSAIGQWQRLSFALNEADWTMLSGDWAALMQHVTLVQVTLEFIYGLEIVWFDNFCLHRPALELLTGKPTEDYIRVFPNPAFERKITISSMAPSLAGSLSVWDIHGKRIMYVADQELNGYEWDGGGLPAGTYFLLIQKADRRIPVKVIFR
ncbi:MAG: T9SS type A sorting domain-containing protein [Saprospiraceae bacterium]|nr:T9SS type A sorting domain-containing protein [Saprospiraceae bacterium]